MADTPPASRDAPPPEGVGFQEAEGQIEGPCPFAYGGELFRNDEEPHVIPAHRFGVRRGGKLRAVDNLKMSDADRAAAPPCSQKTHTAGPRRLENQTFSGGFARQLGMAMADHADAAVLLI